MVGVTVLELRSVEPQYQPEWDAYKRLGPVRLGPKASQAWRTDPRRVLFVLARYKFVAKLLSGRDRVLEVGIGDALGLQIVLQEVGYVVGLDIDPAYVNWANDQAAALGQRASFEVKDLTREGPTSKFSAAYSLDVIEHIDPVEEPAFLANISRSLIDDGVCIIGTPNVTARAYQSEGSALGHINLKSAATLRAGMASYFKTVFLFSMNDEVVHTGFFPMAHYLFAIGVSPR